VSFSDGSGCHSESVLAGSAQCLAYRKRQPAGKVHRAFAASGYEESLQQFTKDLDRLHAAKQMFMPVNLADAYATLGDKDHASTCLNRRTRIAL
jgi:hypothetical protein